MIVKGLEQFEGDPRLAAAVARATKMLEVELGRATERAAVNWSRSLDERGRPLVDLQVSDWTGSLSTHFAPSELFDESQLERRLIRFWGDFLQNSSDKLLEPILESIREHEGR